jgi:hypothetical protein
LRIEAFSPYVAYPEGMVRVTEFDPSDVSHIHTFTTWERTKAAQNCLDLGGIVVRRGRRECSGALVAEVMLPVNERLALLATGQICKSPR